MSKFQIGQKIRTSGENKEVTVVKMRTNKGHTWYVLDDGRTIHERYLWDGLPDKIVACSQLQCQRVIKQYETVEGVDWVKDEHGFLKCMIHEIEYGYER